MKFYLFKHNLSAKQFAAELGVSLSYLYQLLRHERIPSLALALKIERRTKGEVSVDQLRPIGNGKVAFDQAQYSENSTESKLSSLESFVKSLAERVKKLEDYFDRTY